MKIAYLASTVTLPNSTERRDDAHEHDLTIEALGPAFSGKGLELVPVAWDNPDVAWSDFAAAVVGTTWDYWDRQEEFLATLENIASETTLFNSPALIRWNIRKTYLRDLESRGVDIIPTVWLDNPSSKAVEKAFHDLETDVLVVKRQIGAGAHDQHILQRGGEAPSMSRPMMAQPFLPTIRSEGELSFIFVGREFCHALIKKPVPGDYRVQSIYGGMEEAVTPVPEDQRAAEAVLAATEGDLLFARVDMVRGETGELLLMELEIIEPYLYPVQGPELGLRMAAALAERLGLEKT